MMPDRARGSERRSDRCGRHHLVESSDEIVVEKRVVRENRRMTEFSFNDDPFVDLPLEPGDPLQRAIMPIILRRGDVWEVAGTAFAIGPQLLFTAAHTLVDNGVVRGDEAYVLYVGGVNADGTLMGGPLPIEHVKANAGIDVALLQVRLPLIDGTMLALAVLEFSFAAPLPGEVCAVVGYTAGTRFQDLPTEARLDVTANLLASQGTVVELHHGGRDTVVLPFPVFRTTAQIRSQMSGSPIFAGSGSTKRVVGIAATSFELAEGDEHMSYGSLLWPAAALRMSTTGDVDELSLLDLAKLGYVRADHSIDRIDVDKSNPAAWTVSFRQA
jgi:hypothetical protein